MAETVGLAIATPCFGGQISVVYAESIFRLQRVLRTTGDIQLKVLLKDGDALITRARAGLVAQFLDDPAATHLLFVDADIGFDPAQVLRLIDCGAQMCAAIYPIKRIDWGKVRAALQAGRDPSVAALDYVYEVQDPDAVVARAGFIKIRYAGAGFLMVRREALERMIARYGHLQYRRDHSVSSATPSDNRYALFDPMIDETGTYLSEDFAFCRRWTEIGGEIWADLSSALNHVGPLVFRGDLASQFGPAPSVPGTVVPAPAA